MAKSPFCFVWILFKENLQKYKNAHCEVTKYTSTMLVLNNSDLSSLLLLDSLNKFCSLCNMWSNQASCDTGAPCEVNLVDIASEVTFDKFLSLILKFDFNLFISSCCELSTRFSLVLFLLMDKTAIKLSRTETTVTWFTKFSSIHITNEN